MIFRTGSVLIVGKCEDDLLFEIYKFLNNIFIDEFMDIYEDTANLENKKPKLRNKVKKTLYNHKNCIIYEKKYIKN